MTIRHGASSRAVLRRRCPGAPGSELAEQVAVVGVVQFDLGADDVEVVPGGLVDVGVELGGVDRMAQPAAEVIADVART